MDENIICMSNKTFIRYGRGSALRFANRNYYCTTGTLGIFLLSPLEHISEEPTTIRVYRFLTEIRNVCSKGAPKGTTKLQPPPPKIV